MKINIHQQIFKLKIFLKNSLVLFKNENIKFIHPKNFEKALSKKKKKEKFYLH